MSSWSGKIFQLPKTNWRHHLHRFNYLFMVPSVWCIAIGVHSVLNTFFFHHFYHILNRSLTPFCQHKSVDRCVCFLSRRFYFEVCANIWYKWHTYELQFVINSEHFHALIASLLNEINSRKKKHTRNLLINSSYDFRGLEFGAHSRTHL